MKRISLTVILVVLSGLPAVVRAQLVSYESFQGMPLGSGLMGSGTTAVGWSDAGWSNGGDARYQIVDPIPDLTYEIAGGALVDGSDRALQLTTSPEPVPSGLVASRTLPEQNTTIYFSFLVRPVAVGTGSDTLYLRLSNGTNSIALVALVPDISQQYFNLRLLLEGTGGSSFSIGSQELHPAQTYLIAGRITWPSQQSQLRIETWINPSATYPGDGSQRLFPFNFSGAPVLKSVGFGISSTDTGGPTSTAMFDELRVGYTWPDVVSPGPPTPNLANISTRLRVETGDNVLIGGFIISGTDPKKVILRAIGPSLPFAGSLQDPMLELHGPHGLITSNNDWMNAPNKEEIVDTTLAPTNNLESAIVATLPANNAGYTAVLRGANGGTGIGVVEVYDLNRSADSKLANISSRGLVQTGDNVMIGGFIVSGQSSQKVIVRAIGPSLSISGKLGDPTLELYDGNGSLLMANDNWRTGGQESEIAATGVPPSHDLESAIVRTVDAGNYTAIVRGKDSTTGVALVEVFALQ